MYFFIRKVVQQGREREERCVLSAGLLPTWPQWPGLCCANSRSLGLRPGVPRVVEIPAPRPLCYFPRDFSRVLDRSRAAGTKNWCSVGPWHQSFSTMPHKYALRNNNAYVILWRFSYVRFWFLFLRLQGAIVANPKEPWRSECSGAGKWNISATSTAYCVSTVSRMSLTWQLRKDLKIYITVCNNLGAHLQTCNVFISLVLNPKCALCSWFWSFLTADPSLVSLG